MNFGIDARNALALIVILVICGAVMNGALSGLQTVPGPIFGGDVYYQLGEVYRMYEEPAAEWLGSSNGIGGLAHYMPVYGALVTAFGKLLGMAPIAAEMNFNYLLLPISLLAFFLLFRAVFGEREAAIGVALAALTLSFPIFKYTEFTRVLPAPVFVYALYMFCAKQDLRNSIILGLAYGILSLSHSTGFIFGSIAIAAFYFIIFREDALKVRSAREAADFIVERRGMLVAPALGFLIAQIYWFAPVFVFFGKSTNQINIWSVPDYRNLDYSVSFAAELAARHLFNLSSLLAIAKSALALFGLYLVFVKKEGPGFVRDFLLVSAAVTFSYLLTAPILDVNLLPDYMSNIYLSLAVTMAALVGVKRLAERNWMAVLAAVLICLAQFALAQAASFQEDAYYKGAKEGLPAPYKSLQAYLLANTSYRDVVLSAKELSFMVNGVSGRSVMVSRRAHISAFATDVDEREADAAVLLYGNDSAERAALLRKYNVSYVYFDAGWYGMEYQFSQDGGSMGFFDPLMVLWSAEREGRLAQNGVKYYNTYYWLDPSVRGADVRKYRVLINSPDNYDFTGYGPWKDGLDAHLRKVWSWSEGGKEIAALYKVAD